MESTTTSRGLRKLRRNPRACDVCSRRSVRCQPSRDEIGKCQNCVDYGETCSFNRPLRKRGAKSKQCRTADNDIESIKTSNTTSAQDQAPTVLRTLPSPITTTSNHEPFRPSLPVLYNKNTEWQPNISVSQAMVMDLTEIYFEVVYPVFPFFHRPTLVRRVSRGEHLTDRAFFASVMAMCALSSARARDGALYSAKWNTQSLREPTSEVFFQAAENAIPRDATLTQDFDCMRACVLLAITSIQYGKIQLMSHYLGLYNMFVAVGRLHDEGSWPRNLKIVEVEERRRLFWSTYTLDVFTAVIWGGIVRSREASSNVAYPTEIDDEAFSNAGFPEPMDSGKVNWLRGWNFVTDLYRVLEHSVDCLRRVTDSRGRSSFAQTLAESSLSSQPSVLNQILTMYTALPSQFKATGHITCNFSEDLFSFQAANVAATVQLVRMVHFTNDQSTLEQKCQVAGEVIAGFASVPVPYLRAMSSPLLHHLAGIGTILGAAFEQGMTESSYRRVRSVLLDLADLLATLEVDLYCPSETSHKLRTQVSRIDQFMSAQPVSNSLEGYTPHNHRLSTSRNNLTASQPQAINQSATTEKSPQYWFPPELFEDWSWALDLNPV